MNKISNQILKDFTSRLRRFASCDLSQAKAVEYIKVEDPELVLPDVEDVTDDMRDAFEELGEQVLRSKSVAVDANDQLEGIADRMSEKYPDLVFQVVRDVVSDDASVVRTEFVAAYVNGCDAMELNPKFAKLDRIGICEIEQIRDYAMDVYDEFVEEHPLTDEMLHDEDAALDYVSDVKGEFIDEVAQHFGWKNGDEMLQRMDDDYYGYGDGGDEACWKLFQWFSDSYAEMLMDEGEDEDYEDEED